jgi:hypothetical protein
VDVILGCPAGTKEILEEGTMEYTNLDETTRRYMLMELEEDVREGRVILSRLLTNRGQGEFIDLLGEAMRHHDPYWLGSELRSGGRMHIALEDADVQKLAPEELPVYEPDVLAEGEFNRYYVRGMCRRALDEGIEELRIVKLTKGPYASFVYKSGDLPQDEREREVDVADKVDPQWLLEKLRQDPEGEMDLGIPGEPGSGLTVEAPEWRKERQTAR